jgi:uncharacterized membrane protein YfcA
MGLLARAGAGFLVAFVCTPAGISGAFLLLPVQTTIFRVPSPAVSATNFLYNLVATPAGVVTYHRQGRLDWGLARVLCLGTTPGVIIGALIRSTWLADPDRFGWLAAALLLALGVRLLVQLSRPASTPEHPTLPPWWRLLAVGLVAGLVGGIYGLGGAALIVPWLVSVEHLAVARVAGPALLTSLVTSVAGAATFALAAAAGFGQAAAPRWVEGVALGVGGALGSVAGAEAQSRLPLRWLRAVIAVAAITAAIRMLR